MDNGEEEDISTLPSTRALLTQILNHLARYPAPDPSPDSHETTTLPPTTKPLLLTLHSLLPHCLLPALDLLDRGLVQRWIPTGPTNTINVSSWVYYITSKPTSISTATTAIGSSFSSASSITTTNNTSTFSKPTIYIYEVRPSIWHCTCANFTLYAFTGCSETINFEQNADYHSDDIMHTKDDAWIWGGIHLSPHHPSSIPICKHLLAAVLAERCPALFGGSIKEIRQVGKEKMAEKACWWD